MYVVASRELLINSRFPTVICPPIYTNREGLITEVNVGIEEGLKHDSSIRCDELISLLKSVLTNYVGSLSPEKIVELSKALKAALEINN